ncbi:MAG TPA: IS4 family transposase, partial [Methylibium sp.]|nr:IS4 family transposase [Methylibium sp.]
VMDREADFFELFDEQRRRDKVDLLVRAKHDRVTNDEHNLFDGTRCSAVKGRLLIPVPRQSARPKKSKQQARAGHPQRMAQVHLRYHEVELPAPKHHPGKPPIQLWVVHVLEARAPAGATRLEWFLLTTREITSAEQAQECLRWYCLRWRIEDWHRVLKSGCRIETLQHKTARRLKRAIAINLVIAWRIMLMTLLGRQCPDLPADMLFSDLEIEVLQAYAKKTELASPSCLEMQCVS